MRLISEMRTRSSNGTMGRGRAGGPQRIERASDFTRKPRARDSEFRPMPFMLTYRYRLF